MLSLTSHSHSNEPPADTVQPDTNAPLDATGTAHVVNSESGTASTSPTYLNYRDSKSASNPTTSSGTHQSGTTGSTYDNTSSGTTGSTYDNTSSGNTGSTYDSTSSGNTGSTYDNTSSTRGTSTEHNAASHAADKSNQDPIGSTGERGGLLGGDQSNSGPERLVKRGGALGGETKDEAGTSNMKSAGDARPDEDRGLDRNEHAGKGSGASNSEESSSRGKDGDENTSSSSGGATIKARQSDKVNEMLAEADSKFLLHTNIHIPPSLNSIHPSNLPCPHLHPKLTHLFSHRNRQRKRHDQAPRNRRR